MSRQDPRWAKAWRLDRARGRLRYRDPAAAREHVRQLVAAGMSRRAVAYGAGVSPQVVYNVLAGAQGRLQAATYARLMAVTAVRVQAVASPAVFVPAVGTRRRIRALLALGWRHADIAAHGLPHSGVVLAQAGQWVTRATHDRACAAYTALSMTPGPSARTRSRASTLGYPPPAAWDDEDLDDPHAHPGPWRTPAEQGKRRQVHADDVEWLLDAGGTWESIAARLTVERKSIDKALRRQGRHDLITRLTGRTAA